ncbi:hypothetical protein HY486_00055 [Candidatus Woesearchaeota archaeon]|nr:hypothetical protein [Candidatus Woesearchaeota archaeon]
MLWGIFKKKQEDLLPPLPPAPEERTTIPPIKPIELPEPPELPEFPTLPELPLSLPENIEAQPIIEEQPVTGNIKESRQSFVSMNEYQEVTNQANAIKDRLQEAEHLVKELAEIRTEEEKAFEKWRTLLENLEKKLTYVDTLIAGGEPA